mgnify:CR=1 FL=1
MKHYYTIVFTFIATLTFAQNNKQNIRGLVLDKLTQSPIQGAAVHISNSNKTTLSDSIGNYTFSELNPGRYDIKVTYSGYKESYIPNVVVTSGKEIILDIGLEEDFKSLKDVVVKSSNKASSINKMATVSARTFSMEEVNNYQERKNAKMTQEQLADKIGAKKSFISRIENGKTDIQLSTLYRLLEFGLGKTVEVSVN